MSATLLLLSLLVSSAVAAQPAAAARRNSPRTVFLFSRDLNTCDQDEDRHILLKTATNVIYAFHTAPVAWKPSDGGEPVLREHTNQGVARNVDFGAGLSEEMRQQIDDELNAPEWCDAYERPAQDPPVMIPEFDPEAFDEVVDMHAQYKLYWKRSADNKRLHFAVDVATAGWVGLGFSPNGEMLDSDVIMAFIDSEGGAHISDRVVGQEHVRPTVDLLYDLRDTRALITDRSTTSSAVTTTAPPGPTTTVDQPRLRSVFTWSRDINTCDEDEDHQIDIRTPTNVAFAYQKDAVQWANEETRVPRLTRHNFATHSLIHFGDGLTEEQRAEAWATTQAVSWCENYEAPTPVRIPEYFDAFNASAFTHSYRVNADYTLYWARSNQNTRIHFAMAATIEGWVGFGIALASRGMENIDIALGFIDPDNEPHLADRYAATPGVPKLDKQNDLRDLRAMRRPAEATDPDDGGSSGDGWQTRHTVLLVSMGGLLVVAYGLTHSVRGKKADSAGSGHTLEDGSPAGMSSASSLLESTVQGGRRHVARA